MGALPGGGNYHPLLKVRAEFRRILMEMGFEEMPTSKWVESSFWNFDSLFQPQSHPARDAHDTFFMKDPETCQSVPEDYYEIGMFDWWCSYYVNVSMLWIVYV